MKRQGWQSMTYYKKLDVDFTKIRTQIINNQGATMNDITLYDLMAEDLTVWIQKNKKFGFDLTIEDENNNETIEISGVHSAAMESFSDFCRRFVEIYDLAKEGK